MSEHIGATPSYLAESVATLSFAKRSAINTDLLLNGRPYISVTTIDSEAALTTITNLQTKEQLVTIKRRTFLPDSIKFPFRYEGKSLKVKEWLRESTMVDGSTSWTVQTAAGNFFWKRGTQMRLALYPEYDANRPVAWLQSEPSSSNDSNTLVIKRDIESFTDEIVAAYVILEQRIRLEEKAKSRAEGVLAMERVTATMGPRNSGWGLRPKHLNDERRARR